MNDTQLENLALEWFAETGWQTETGPKIAPDSDSPMKRAILRINPGLPGAAVDEVIHKLKAVDHPILVHRNRSFHRYLTDGIKVEVNEDSQWRKCLACALRSSYHCCQSRLCHL
jgi:type I restriction enzyme, R subunit